MRLLALAASFIALGSLAQAQVLPAGCDCYVTDPPPMGDSTIEIPALPPGFFSNVLGVPSDPFAPLVIAVQGEPLPPAVVQALCPNAATFETVWVDRHGTVVAPDDSHRVGSSTIFTGLEPIDTIICRPAPVPLPAMGGTAPVAIELVELSLRSVTPITVTYGGGASRFWNVFVTEAGVMPGGSMAVTTMAVVPGVRTSGGIAMTDLPVVFEFTFVETTGTLLSVPFGPNMLSFDDPSAGNFQFNILPPAPPNDDCQNAIPAGLGSNPFVTTNSTTDGSPLDPIVCDLGPFGDEQIYNDVWFSFVAPATDFFTFDTDDRTGGGDSSYDTRLALYDSNVCPDDPLLVLGCDDDQDFPFEVQAGFAVHLTGDQAYMIRVGGFDGNADGNGDLFITIAPPPPTPPANDDCGNAQAVGFGLTTYDPSLAGDSADSLAGGSCGFSTIFADVWFTFMAPTTASYCIEIVPNGSGTYDSKLAVYDNSSCPADVLDLVDCDDDGGIGAFSKVTASLNAGQVYLIRAGSYGSGTSANSVDLEIGFAPVPPPNDDCGNATVITAHALYAFDNTLATTDGPDLFGVCSYSGSMTSDISHDDVWFEYIPTVGGCTYISTFGLAGFDTRLAIYDTATCPIDPMTSLACSDEEKQLPIAAPWEAGMDVDLVAGNTYMIQVGNFNSMITGGAGMLRIAPGPVAVTNDSGIQSGAPGCTPPPVFQDLCNGNGDVIGCGVCPCGNFAPSGTIGGCLNRAGTATRLYASGDTSVSLATGPATTTDLRFNVDGLPPLTFGVLISGDAIAPTGVMNPCNPFMSGIPGIDRDGLRCAVMNTFRHGGRSADALGEINAATGPSRAWGGEAQPHGGIFTQGGFSAGQTRFFQLTHREDSTMVCNFGLNTSQAIGVTFSP